MTTLPSFTTRERIDAESRRRAPTVGRPWSVTVAVSLLWTQLIWSAALVLIAIADRSVLRDVIWDLYDLDPADQVARQNAERAATLWVLAVAVVAGLTAALFVALAVAVSRGSDTGQLLATISAGLAIAAYSWAGFMCAQMNGQPEWFRTSMTALTIVAVATMATAVALLHIRASREYFLQRMIAR